MGAYALAIDLGASSGRHILGHVEHGEIVLEEIHRFSNDMVHRDGHTCWDMDALYAQIIAGLRVAAKLGKCPASIGIDTWGVDYSLIGWDGERVGEPIAYRDPRTEGMPEKLDRAISPERLYALTGTARQSYNTLYQLMAEEPERLRDARSLLFTPCYLNYRLTGIAKNEYTIASTSGLLDAQTREWSPDALAAAGIPQTLLGDAPVAPGTRIGALLPTLAAEVGFPCEVIAPASHDTASAFLAVPQAENHAAYLVSGTWSLLGMALDTPVLTREARLAGFTNEGGYGGKITFLRNIIGLWLLQSLRREWDHRLSYEQMADLARQGEVYRPTFDVTHERFLAPASMQAEIQAELTEKGEPLPASDAELLYCVHHSLALCYRDAVANLAALTGHTLRQLHIVGGGCQNQLLNQLTADATGLTVLAGPVESTAIGNLVAQWVAMGEIRDAAQAGDMIRRSVKPTAFEPRKV